MLLKKQCHPRLRCFRKSYPAGSKGQPKVKLGNNTGQVNFFISKHSDHFSLFKKYFPLHQEYFRNSNKYRKPSNATIVELQRRLSLDTELYMFAKQRLLKMYESVIRWNWSIYIREALKEGLIGLGPKLGGGGEEDSPSCLYFLKI